MKTRTENDISYLIRGAIFKVYSHFGPGLFESVYVAALEQELTKQGLAVKREVAVPAFYDEIQLDLGFRLDLLVENLAEVHHKQVITYLKLTGKKLGILVNFNCPDIGEGIFRKVNGL